MLVSFSSSVGWRSCAYVYPELNPVVRELFFLAVLPQVTGLILIEPIWSQALSEPITVPRAQCADWPGWSILSYSWPAPRPTHHKMSQSPQESTLHFSYSLHCIVLCWIFVYVYLPPLLNYKFICGRCSPLRHLSISHPVWKSADIHCKFSKCCWMKD